MISVACEECGTSLVRWPANLKGRKFGSFCDRNCLGKYRTRVLVGDLAANYKNGLTMSRKYVMAYAPWHPKAKDGRYIPLHRLIAEAKLGRYLKRGEVVHHKDENQSNNHWENLEIITQKEHATEHMKNRKRDINTGRLK